jgi:hypothetical protein
MISRLSGHPWPRQPWPAAGNAKGSPGGGARLPAGRWRSRSALTALAPTALPAAGNAEGSPGRRRPASGRALPLSVSAHGVGPDSLARRGERQGFPGRAAPGFRPGVAALGQRSRRWPRQPCPPRGTPRVPRAGAPGFRPGVAAFGQRSRRWPRQPLPGGGGDRAGRRHAQEPVHFACTVGRTTPLEHVPAKSAGDEHVSGRLVAVGRTDAAAVSARRPAGT